MAEPIIFTLLFGSNDQILEKIRKETVLDSPTIVSLQTSKESRISDKERIFAEILKESMEQNKNPIFNVQLNNNNVKPIFKSQDLINLQNLNIKSTITFEHYNSLAGNPELAAYWKEILAKTNHVFFANEQDRELAINENALNRDKATTITDTNSVLSVFNNLADDKKVNKLLSGAIPDKAELDKLIKKTKNQGGRVTVKTWPLSLDQATNLIIAKFGITSDDQIYGLKLEITEILKDPNNAAENLKKYVSQISRQFQKDLGKSEVNPIDFNFDREQVMKNIPDPQKETTISYETKQPEQPGFFRRVFNYFKSVITSYLGKKEETQAFQPQPTTKTEPELIELPKEQTQEKTTPILAAIKQQTTQQINTNSSQKDWEKIGMTEQAYKTMMSNNIPAVTSNTTQHDPFRIPLEVRDINDVKKPNHWYENHQIQYILEASLDKNNFSVHAPISLNQNIDPSLLPTDQIPENVLKNAISQVTDGKKKAAVIPIEMGYGHWTGLVATYDEKDKQVILTFNDSLGNSIDYDGKKLPKLIDKALGNLPNKPIIIDEKIKQQDNNFDCGVFTVDNLIKIAKGQQILKTNAQELRNQHAEILTQAMTKQQAQGIGQQMQKDPKVPNNKYQNMIKSQNTSKNKERTL